MMFKRIFLDPRLILRKRLKAHNIFPKKGIYIKDLSNR